MRRNWVLATIVALVLAGCGASSSPPSGPPPAPQAGEVSRLASAIRSLGPHVDPAEAERAASLAYTYSATLAREYQITDGPLTHNTKVNMGIKPRGLCWHWAEDLEKRLSAEGFETLEMHRAIAEPDNIFRLEHSTAIISARGDSFDEGLVLDPWRKGGQMSWMPVEEDSMYNWEARTEVAARRLQRKHGQIVTLTDDQIFLMNGKEYRLQ